MKEEVMYAIKHRKGRKAPGPDEIPIELLKIINEDNIDVLVDLFNSIYKTGHIPKEWLLSTFVTIPKITNAKDCNDYRTIALMSHTLKTFLKIIHNRIHMKLEQEISDSQMGFRKGLGTREALFGVHVLTQRCLDMNQDIYACFIDFKKAFDRVQHEKLLSILKTKNIDSRDLQIISNLYQNQKARVRVEGELTEEVSILRGVRQGCILSPLLFNVYSEVIFQEALLDIVEGIYVNGNSINNIRYADDTVIFASDMEDLQYIIQHVYNACESYGLQMNLKKTKSMIFSKKPQNVNNLIINNTTIERVKTYKYLGTWLTEDGDQVKEIRSRIEMARNTFIKLKKLLCNRNLNLEIRTRMLRCYVFSTLLYGMEAWTIKQSEIKKLNSFEMWCYRRMHKISWIEKVTNIEVLQRMKKECEVIKTVKIRKIQYLGHLMRGEKYVLLRLIMQGKIQGKRNPGRRKMSWLRNLREWFGCSSLELFRNAANKVKIAMMISNLR